MKTLTALFVAFLITPFAALLQTVALRLLWAWFLAPEYGPGPSTRAWFGIGVLGSLALMGLHYNRTDQKKISVTTVLVRVLTLQLVLWLIVLSAFVSAQIFGWL